MTTDAGPLPFECSDEAIADFAHRWEVSELAVFGSALRDDFGPESDVDILLTFAPESRPNLFDLAEMAEQLTRLFGRPVDIATRPAVEASRNWIRRAEILASARILYAAA